MNIPREPQFPRQHIRGMEVMEKLNNLGVRTDTVDLAELEVIDGELHLRRAEGDPAD
jgi:hypothetical protein